jgi:hypothetical protein
MCREETGPEEEPQRTTHPLHMLIRVTLLISAGRGKASDSPLGLAWESSMLETPYHVVLGSQLLVFAQSGNPTLRNS